MPPILVCFLPNTNRLVTTFWLRNDRVTRRLKTSKPQGLTRHLVHTPTRHCLLFVLHTSTPHYHLLVLPCLLPFTSYRSYISLLSAAAIVFSPPRRRRRRRRTPDFAFPSSTERNKASFQIESFVLYLTRASLPQIFRNFSKGDPRGGNLRARSIPLLLYPSFYKFPSSRMQRCVGATRVLHTRFVTAVSESNKTVDATWSRRKTRQTNFEIPISPSWIYVSDINRGQ